MAGTSSTVPIDRREAILDVAERLIRTVGYERTSIQAIQDELGISRGAVYHYFGSKEDLLEAVVERMADAIGQALRADPRRCRPCGRREAAPCLPGGRTVEDRTPRPGAAAAERLDVGCQRGGARQALAHGHRPHPAGARDHRAAGGGGGDLRRRLGAAHCSRAAGCAPGRRRDDRRAPGRASRRRHRYGRRSRDVRRVRDRRWNASSGCRPNRSPTSTTNCCTPGSPERQDRREHP